MSTLILVGSWTVIALVCVGYGYYVYRSKLTADRRRKLRPVGPVAFFVWAIGGTITWSPLMKLIPMAARPVLAPVAVTSWPAHEIALYLTGYGFGANALPNAVVMAIGSAVWAAILWLPMFALRSPKFPLWFGLVAQAAFFVAVSALFFQYGNG